MENNITVNMDNLSTDERNTLLELIKKANKSNKVWKPCKNEEYWYISTIGKICNCINCNTDEDNRVYKLGNCFKSKEEAEFALEKQKVTTELKRFALENNDELYWNDTDRKKYFIVYDYGSKFIDFVFSYFKKMMNNIYFSSREIAQEAVKTIGEERLKKYYFEVSDNE